MKYKIVKIHTEVFDEYNSNSKKNAIKIKKRLEKNSNDEVFILKNNEDVVFRVVKQ
jgi:hypothetical protein